MSNQLVAFELGREDYENWDVAVSDSVGGSPYSLSTYLGALCKAAGGEFRLLAVRNETRIVGGIGLYVRPSGGRKSVRGRYLLYYNGPFVRHLPGANASSAEENAHRVMACIEERLRQSNYKQIQIKPRNTIRDCRPFLRRGWLARPVYSYVVDISDTQECLARMHRNVRRQIRRAEQGDIEAARSDDIAFFYDLHRQTCRRKGFPTYLERDKMIEFYEELRDRDLIRLYMAGNSGSAQCAGILVLAGDHPVTHTIAAASSDEKLPQGVNAYLRWYAFRDLAASGHTANDLTDAHEPSVAKFKRQLGARLVVSQQLNLPMTAADHVRAAYGISKRNLKQSVKRLIGRGEGT